MTQIKTLTELQDHDKKGRPIYLYNETFFILVNTIFYTSFTEDNLIDIETYKHAEIIKTSINKLYVNI